MITCPAVDIERYIRNLIPDHEFLLAVEPIKGGFSNDIWRVTTDHGHYIFRSQKNKIDPQVFLNTLEVIKSVSNTKIGPKLINADTEEQQILLEFVESEPWKAYALDSKPYDSAMEALRKFHEVLQPFSTDKDYAAFNLINTMGKDLIAQGLMPDHFLTALEKVDLIYKKMLPWLEKNATLCHGDFHKSNALLHKREGNYEVYLIDFDSLSKGHPFFDVAKFSIAHPKKERDLMLAAYLGNREPTSQEYAHFELVDLALLMVISVLRFIDVKKMKSKDSDCLSKKEMEDLLNSKNPLPSFLSISYADNTTMAKQLGAIYALSEFLRRTEHSSFTDYIEMI